MSPLVFSTNPQLSPAENRSRVLVGFRFDDGSGGGGSGGGYEALILNLGNSTRTLDVQAVFSHTYTADAADATALAAATAALGLQMVQLFAKTRVDAATSLLNASLLGRDVSDVAPGASVTLRAYSVTSLRS
jgi:hypothetical protein